MYQRIEQDTENYITYFVKDYKANKTLNYNLSRCISNKIQ